MQYGTGNILDTSGVFTFDEDILTTYFDLDALISECGLTKTEMWIVQAMMEGYTVRDIIQDKNYADATAVFNRLDCAAEKIVTRNNERWMESIDMAHHRKCRNIIKKKAELRERHK